MGGGTPDHITRHRLPSTLGALGGAGGGGGGGGEGLPGGGDGIGGGGGGGGGDGMPSPGGDGGGGRGTTCVLRRCCASLDAAVHVQFSGPCRPHVVRQPLPQRNSPLQPPRPAAFASAAPT